MSNLHLFDTLEDLDRHTSRLRSERWHLESRIAHERRQIVKQFKKERHAQTATLEDQTRQDLFDQLIAYRDYILDEWVASNEDYAHLAYLDHQLGEIEKLYEDLQRLRTKTNKEWLAIIVDLMNKRGHRGYSVKFFERDFEYIGVGTHSDTPHWSETDTETVVAIVAYDFNIDIVHNYTFSWPDEHPEDYARHDFILYDRPGRQVQPEAYLLEQRVVMHLYGMPDDIATAIDEMLFQQYKQQ